MADGCEAGHPSPPPGDQASYGDLTRAGQGQLQGRHTGGAPAQAGGGECAAGDGGVEIAFIRYFFIYL